MTKVYVNTSDNCIFGDADTTGIDICASRDNLETAMIDALVEFGFSSDDIYFSPMYPTDRDVVDIIEPITASHTWIVYEEVRSEYDIFAGM